MDRVIDGVMSGLVFCSGCDCVPAKQGNLDYDKSCCGIGEHYVKYGNKFRTFIDNSYHLLCCFIHSFFKDGFSMTLLLCTSKTAIPSPSGESGFSPESSHSFFLGFTTLTPHPFGGY